MTSQTTMEKKQGAINKEKKKKKGDISNNAEGKERTLMKSDI